MKWLGWPTAVLAAAMSMTADGANFSRYGRFANDDVETATSTANPGVPISAPQPVPVPDDVANAAPLAAPAPYNGCNCGNGYGGGGYMGFSWASGCGAGPSCCNGIWDNYCGQKRSWCNRSNCGCGVGSNCGSAFSPICGGSGCGLFSNWGRGNCGTGCATAAPTCDSGCSAVSGCSQPAWFQGNCGLQKVRGYARNCWSSLCGTVSNDCTTNGCTTNGCTDGVMSSVSAAPIVEPEDSLPNDLPRTFPTPTRGPAVKEAPIPMTSPEAPAPRGNKAPAKQPGKSASRDNSSRRSVTFGSFPLGY